MYTFEKIKTNDFGPDGLPIWEVVVRDRNGHAVHTDCCCTRDLDRLIVEFQTAFKTIADPKESQNKTAQSAHRAVFVTGRKEAVSTLTNDNEAGQAIKPRP